MFCIFGVKFCARKIFSEDVKGTFVLDSVLGTGGLLGNNGVLATNRLLATNGVLASDGSLTTNEVPVTDCVLATDCVTIGVLATKCVLATGLEPIRGVLANNGFGFAVVLSIFKMLLPIKFRKFSLAPSEKEVNY